MEKFIDTHAHYDNNKFKNRNILLQELQDNVQYIINLGTNMTSNTSTLQLISLYDYIFGMIGFFPTDTWQLEDKLCPNDVDMFIFNAKDNWNVFLHQLINQKLVGIGEIGLDYYWNDVKPFYKNWKHGESGAYGEEARNIQKKWFRKQLNLAQELNMPVSMHSRNAEEDTLKIFEEYESIKGVMHCFSYGLKSAEIYLNKGLYLGVGGTSTYPANKELREVIKEIPLDRLLLETDAPYLSPQPVRKKINDSSNIKYIIKNIAELKQISCEEVISVTNKNAIKLFGFQKR